MEQSALAGCGTDQIDHEGNGQVCCKRSHLTLTYARAFFRSSGDASVLSAMRAFIVPAPVPYVLALDLFPHAQLWCIKVTLIAGCACLTDFG